MRSRWQEWVIVLSIVALGGIGVWTIWGKDLMKLFRPEDAAQAEAPAAAPANVAAPAGQAAGPF